MDPSIAARVDTRTIMEAGVEDGDVGESASATEAGHREGMRRADEQALTTAVLAGASAFVLKDIRSNGLIDTIRRVAAGENLLDSAQAYRLVEAWRVHGDADPRLRVLTPQERRILEHIAAGLTNRQIGEEMFLAREAVKTSSPRCRPSWWWSAERRPRSSPPPTRAASSGAVAPDGTLGPVRGGHRSGRIVV